MQHLTYWICSINSTCHHQLLNYGKMWWSHKEEQNSLSIILWLQQELTWFLTATNRAPKLVKHILNTNSSHRGGFGSKRHHNVKHLGMGSMKEDQCKWRLLLWSDLDKSYQKQRNSDVILSALVAWLGPCYTDPWNRHGLITEGLWLGPKGPHWKSKLGVAVEGLSEALSYHSALPGLHLHSSHRSSS